MHLQLLFERRGLLIEKRLAHDKMEKRAKAAKGREKGTLEREAEMVKVRGRVVGGFKLCFIFPSWGVGSG